MEKSDLVAEVIKRIGLPRELAELRYTSKYHDLVADILISFSLSELVVSGLLKRVKQGFYSMVDYRMKLATQLVVNAKTPFGVTSGIILSESNLYERMSVK